MKAQWIVTTDGSPVAGTNAYTRRRAIALFCGGRVFGWLQFSAAGYEVVRVELKSALRQKAKNPRIKR